MRISKLAEEFPQLLESSAPAGDVATGRVYRAPRCSCSSSRTTWATGCSALHVLYNTMLTAWRPATRDEDRCCDETLRSTGSASSPSDGKDFQRLSRYEIHHLLWPRLMTREEDRRRDGSSRFWVCWITFYRVSVVLRLIGRASLSRTAGRAMSPLIVYGAASQGSARSTDPRPRAPDQEIAASRHDRRALPAERIGAYLSASSDRRRPALVRDLRHSVHAHPRASAAFFSAQTSQAHVAILTMSRRSSRRSRRRSAPSRGNAGADGLADLFYYDAGLRCQPHGRSADFGTRRPARPARGRTAIRARKRWSKSRTSPRGAHRPRIVKRSGPRARTANVEGARMPLSHQHEGDGRVSAMPTRWSHRGVSFAVALWYGSHKSAADHDASRRLSRAVHNVRPAKN